MADGWTEATAPAGPCIDRHTGDRQDWSMEGRADLGHGVIDIAPTSDAEWPCAVSWYGWKLSIPDHWDDRHWLKQLLDRMANVGILAKTGGVYRCEHCPRTHQSPCAYQLVLDPARRTRTLVRARAAPALVVLHRAASMRCRPRRARREGSLMTSPEAYEAAALAYDEAVNAALGNPPGSVLGEHGRRLWTEHPAFRAAVDAVWPIAETTVRAKVAAEIRAVDVQRIADLEGDSARVGLTVAARIAEGGA